MEQRREAGGGEPTFARRERVMAREVEGETVLLDVDGGEYFSLDPVGSRVWALCDGSRSIDDIVVQITAEFDVDQATARTDVGELLESLVDAELVVVS